MQGCSHRCVFCNQAVLHPEEKKLPDLDSIFSVAEKYTNYSKKEDRELAFFGGNFCGLSRDEKSLMIDHARSVMKAFSIKSIRISTRPDSITDDEAIFLKCSNVAHVELGAQSFDDNVLRISKRGHSSSDIVNSVEILKKHYIRVGLHMMPGLPGANRESDTDSAIKAAELKPDTVRIHPTLVLKGSELEKEYLAGRYKPMSIDETVKRCSSAIDIFTAAGIKVIRVGLHGDDELLSGRAIVAGPFHPSLRDLIKK